MNGSVMVRRRLRWLGRAIAAARDRFDGQEYRIPWPGPDEISDRARQAALAGRRRRGGAAVILHGVMPRAGTVYVGELLRLHPDLLAYPNDIWELPLLENSPQILELQQAFVRGYRHNAARIGSADFLPMLGNAILDYLYPAEQGSGRRLLLKEAGVRQLGAFPLMFPHEHLLLLLRDGRDLVHSTLRTWPKRDFADVCREWAAASRAARRYHELYRTRSPSCWLVRYEDVQSDPAAFVQSACERFDLDVARFPFGRIAQVRLIGSSTIAGPGQVDWQRHQPKPADFHPLGHWQHWPDRHRRLFKKLAGAELVAAGYAADLNW